MANKENPQKTWYYGVVYFHNGEASVSAPFDSLEKCIDEMKKGIMTHPHLVRATTYMTRKSEEILPVRKLFGEPRSRDLMQDKAFLRELEGK